MNFLSGAEAEKFGGETIGVRPEHIDIADDGPWRGTVGIAEHMGSDTILHVHDTGLADTLTVRATGEVDLKHGDTVTLGPQLNQIHRFNAAGERLTQ